MGSICAARNTGATRSHVIPNATCRRRAQWRRWLAVWWLFLRSQLHNILSYDLVQRRLRLLVNHLADKCRQAWLGWWSVPIVLEWQRKLGFATIVEIQEVLSLLSLWGFGMRSSLVCVQGGVQLWDLHPVLLSCSSRRNEQCGNRSP